MKGSLALLVAILAMVGPTPAGDLPEQWPDSWKEAYGKFEQFLATRAERWPVTTIEVSNSGSFSAEFSFRTDDSKSSIEFYQGGFRIAEIGRLQAEAPPMILADFPGPQAAVVEFATELGFQHIPPIRWFKVESDSSDASLTLSSKQRRFVEVPAPKPEDSVWPNDRMLAWLDYLALGKNRDQILSENVKVKPRLRIQVDRTGGLHLADVVDPKSARALEWRIYKNGRLVDKSSFAAGIPEITKKEWGAYIALVGVNGPDGFLPVSNLLRFLITPDDAGGLELFLSDGGGHVPDKKWFHELFSREPRAFPDRSAASRAKLLYSINFASHTSDNTSDAAWIYQK